jgi:hypothetical protein
MIGGGPSVLYDAVAIVVSEAGAAELAQQGGREGLRQRRPCPLQGHRLNPRSPRTNRRGRRHRPDGRRLPPTRRTHLSEGLHHGVSRSALVGSRHDRAALTHQLLSFQVAVEATATWTLGWHLGALARGLGRARGATQSLRFVTGGQGLALLVECVGLAVENVESLPTGPLVN